MEATEPTVVLDDLRERFPQLLTEPDGEVLRALDCGVCLFCGVPADDAVCPTCASSG